MDTSKCLRAFIFKCRKLHTRNQFDPIYIKIQTTHLVRNIISTLIQWRKQYETFLSSLGWQINRGIFSNPLTKKKILQIINHVLNFHQPSIALVNIMETNAFEETKKLVCFCVEIRHLKKFTYSVIKDKLIKKIRKMLSVSGRFYNKYTILLNAFSWDPRRLTFRHVLSKKEIEFLALSLIQIHQPQSNFFKLNSIEQCNCFAHIKKYFNFIIECSKLEFLNVERQIKVTMETRKILQQTQKIIAKYFSVLHEFKWNKKKKQFYQTLSYYDVLNLTFEFGNVECFKAYNYKTLKGYGVKENSKELIRNYKLPITHEVILEGHEKRISSMAIDKKGKHLITGSWDYQCKLWNFSCMNRSLKPFSSFSPFYKTPIISLSYSPCGKHFLVVTTSSQAKIFNVLGEETKKFVKGDCYLINMNETKGHVSSLSGGMWHPKDKENVTTWSYDGTLRLWDINKEKCLQIV